MDDWKIEIRNRAAYLLTDIFIYRKSFDNKIIVFTYKGGDIIEDKTYGIGEAIEPTLSIPNDLVPLLLEALIRKGVKSPDQSYTEGKLEATEYHLEDLRKLLKFKPTITGTPIK